MRTHTFAGVALLLAACATPPATPPPATSPPKPVVQASPAKVAKAGTAPAAPKAVAPKAAAPAKAAAAPLDLKALEGRLKETGAIGVMTKLSLKNQVDDLVSNFRAYHAGHRPPTLAELRPSFDLLVMKVLSLLQDKDAALAQDIHASRDAIWSILTDPNKLARFS